MVCDEIGIFVARILPFSCNMRAVFGYNSKNKIFFAEY